MKTLHRNNFYCWSEFDSDRNIDFHSYVWVRDEGLVVFDPMPISSHDKAHLDALGTVTHIIITNADHVRNARILSEHTGAEIWAPEAEKALIDLPCSRWISERDVLIDGLQAYGLSGSKTRGEMAFLIEGDTLVTGDLLRAHSGGALCILPDAKLEDRPQAITSIKRLASIGSLSAILPGDGWPVFRDGQRVLEELVSRLQ